MSTVTNITLCSPRPSTTKQGDSSSPIAVKSSLDLDAIPNHHIVIKVARFGFSANNITYQALGEHPHFRYFDFHPAPTPELRKTHGLIPVWGFGSVVASKHPKIPVGERVYGYFAPAKYLVVPVSPSDVNKYAFYVPRPHLPDDRRPYNQVQRCGTDPMYFPEAEDLAMLYRPLFWTSYWCEDWMHSTGCYKPSETTPLAILISSASSKTAFCLAYLVQKRIHSGELKNVKVIGLTSKRNVGFTQKLGLYDEVYEYNTFRNGQAFKGPDVDRQWIYVDVAGNNDLNDKLRDHFASNNAGRIIKNVALGFTNLQPLASAVDDLKWDDTPFNPNAQALAQPGDRWPNVDKFFMPEWLNVRKHQLPISEIFQRQQTAWKNLLRDGANWVVLKPVYGAEKVRDAYVRLAKEGLGPEEGLIWSLWEEEGAGSAHAKL